MAGSRLEVVRGARLALCDERVGVATGLLPVAPVVRVLDQHAPREANCSGVAEALGKPNALLAKLLIAPRIAPVEGRGAEVVVPEGNHGRADLEGDLDAPLEVGPALV